MGTCRRFRWSAGVKRPLPPKEDRQRPSEEGRVDRGALRTVYGYVRKVDRALRVVAVSSSSVYGPLQRVLRYGYGPYTAVYGVNGYRGCEQSPVDARLVNFSIKSS